jgi:hypothetical protein
LRSNLLLLILFLSSFDAKAVEHYLDYHHGIIRCEELFLKGNTRLALAGYQNLFTEYSKPFAKDCFIAVQLSCTTTDTAATSYFFSKAFERGVTWTAITSSPVITEYFEKRPAFLARIQRDYQPRRNKWEHGINYNLQSVIIGMKRRDDKVKWKMNFLNTSSSAFYKRAEEYAAVVDSNAAELLRLTKRYGFLGDNILGFVESWLIRDSVDARKRASYGLYSFVDQLFFHQNCLYILLRPELRKALDEGEISPAMYALIHDWARNWALTYPTTPSFRKDLPESKICKPTLPDNLYFGLRGFPLSPKDIPYVDSCRTCIGLASIAHVQRKKEFEKSHELKLFFGSNDLY